MTKIRAYQNPWYYLRDALAAWCRTNRQDWSKADSARARAEKRLPLNPFPPDYVPKMGHPPLEDNPLNQGHSIDELSKNDRLKTEWLAAPGPIELQAHEWRGGRCLGKGSDGITGLVLGLDEFGITTQRVVVKEVRPENNGWRDPIEWRNQLPREISTHLQIEEAREAVNGVGFENIVQCYGYHLDVQNCYYRLYLEYCPVIGDFGRSFTNMDPSHSLTGDNLPDGPISISRNRDNPHAYVFDSLERAYPPEQQNVIYDENGTPIPLSEWTDVWQIGHMGYNLIMNGTEDQHGPLRLVPRDEDDDGDDDDDNDKNIGYFADKRNPGPTNTDTSQPFDDAQLSFGLNVYSVTGIQSRVAHA
ncbi:hypothetical protein J3E72DRAFT_273677 [Bipolaris maydis]|nr:hypothetical protein J3E72DRAFT_273677 [Bipolaris maydis]